MSDVFISHSSIDKEIADKLCNALEERGLKCWIAPRDILPGSEWAASISDALNDTKAMLLIYSHNSAKSTQVPKELNIAEKKGKFIIPYKVDDTELTGVFDYFLTGAHWIMANPADGDYKVDELYNVITGEPQSVTRSVTNMPYVQKENIAISNTAVDKQQKNSKALLGIICAIGLLIVALLVVLIIMLSGKMGNENNKADDDKPNKLQEELVPEDTPEPVITEAPEEDTDDEFASVENFEYTIANGEVTITKYVGNLEDVVIPAEINGAQVTVIGKDAFYDCTELKTIVLPEGILEIGASAFFGCTGLQQVKIPDSVVKLGLEAFLYCENLTTVTLSNNLEILEANLFNGCTSLTSVTLPDNLKIIEMNAFRESGLQKIVIPDSVTYIGESAFYDCTELSAITLPAGITEITPFMLRGCSNLTSVTIPDSVTTIGQAAFAHSGLKEVNVPDSVVYMEGSVFYDCVNLEYAQMSVKMNYLPEYSFCGCSSLNNITISKELEVIGEWALCDTNFSGLSLELFNIKEVGQGAFSDCANLETLTLPDTLVKISEGAFQYCPKLTEVTIPTSVKGCAVDAFWGNEEITITYDDAQYTLLEEGILNDELYGLLNITKDFEYAIAEDGVIITKYKGADTVVVVPEVIEGVYVTAIGEEAFAERSDIEFVTMFHRVKSVGKGAFVACTNLKMVDLSSELVSIGDSAFEGCNSLEYVELAGTLTEIGVWAFGRTALKYVTIPQSVAIINYAAFYGCEQLVGAYLVDGIAKIDRFAFGKTALKNVTIPYTVTELATNAFAECKELSVFFEFVRYDDWSKLPNIVDLGN